MYHCKIARTEKEFTAIARLNYETFVEEIPQHLPNESRLLVDKFHLENTYIVLYKNEQLIGMLAFRDQRPFSIDLKIGAVENYLPDEQCKKLCEVRLLAIKKQYRTGRVFLRLAQALYAYVLGQKYSACVISGITSQADLYKHIGFTQFADAIGDDNAMFFPMVLTSEGGQKFYRQFQRKNVIFFPGPVQQLMPLQHTTVSHRSEMFESLLDEMKQKLKSLVNTTNVIVINGSGTAANEMMLLQIKAKFQQRKGLICTNGEFGDRLINQANALQLQFDIYRENFGEAFCEHHLADRLKDVEWCVFVHGETSSGMLNNLQMFVRLKQQLGFTLAIDCISSFGAVPISLKNVDLATATSGKAIGAIAGLSFMFYEGQLINSSMTYLNAANYIDCVPFTLPAYLVSNVLEHLKEYPNRFDLLAKRLDLIKEQKQISLLSSRHYPTAVSFQANEAFIQDAYLNGIELHTNSSYLRQQSIAQISAIQPTFEKDYQLFLRWIEMYRKIEL